MNIVYCSPEVYPFSKTGGLADVAGSLPLALANLGHKVLVITPKYRGIRVASKKIHPRVNVHFIRNDKYFDRANLYGVGSKDYKDNCQRFAYFCQESLKLLKDICFQPDIIINNDWQTGLIGVYLKTIYKNDSFFDKTKSVFTIHNLAYQGLFPKESYHLLGLEGFGQFFENLEFFGKISLLKGGLIASDLITAVSPSYAKEIQTVEHGCGLENVLRKKSQYLVGIVNGIDYEVWNPAKDKYLAHKFSVDKLRMRASNKAELQKIVKFDRKADVPLFGMVTRLVEQKGLDILSDALPQILKQDLQLVILGKGNATYEKYLKIMQKKYPKKLQALFEFSGSKASLIYGGSDFFLMPSRYEPCGLGQMIAFRYGSIPVARRTGGLSDTILDIDVHPTKGNGILFEEYLPQALIGAMQRAVNLYSHNSKIHEIQHRGMKLDFSWNRSAQDYELLFEDILSQTCLSSD